MSTLTFLPATPVAAANFYENTNQKLEGIKSDVVFGKASRGCAGLGICSVVASSQYNISTATACANSTAIINKDCFGQIRFYFINSSICIKARKKQFRKDYFTVGESFVLPAEIIRTFGLNNGFVEAGQYPIVKLKDYTLVVFSAV